MSSSSSSACLESSSLALARNSRVLCRCSSSCTLANSSTMA
eukprot:jgi/Chrpa1/18296/Chrysochromulina_OHIO_Genome00022286-RA